jgi:hypothetical protein
MRYFSAQGPSQAFVDVKKKLYTHLPRIQSKIQELAHQLCNRWRLKFRSLMGETGFSQETLHAKT